MQQHDKEVLFFLGILLIVMIILYNLIGFFSASPKIIKTNPVFGSTNLSINKPKIKINIDIPQKELSKKDITIKPAVEFDIEKSLNNKEVIISINQYLDISIEYNIEITLRNRIRQTKELTLKFKTEFIEESKLPREILREYLDQEFYCSDCN